MQEYQKHEFCKNTKCVNFVGKVFSKNRCSICEAYLFHKYLQEQGYKIIKEDKEEFCGSVDHYIQGVS